MKIIRDTREKEGVWDFYDSEIIVRKLDTGDYSLAEYEDKVCIERKKSTSEIATNLGKDFARFSRELERMKSFPFAYLICEFTLQDVLSFPKGSGISPKLLKEVRMNGKYMIKLLSSFKEKYGVEVIYAGDRETAILECEKIFSIVGEMYG